jgi:hypothetical protein
MLICLIRTPKRPLIQTTFPFQKAFQKAFQIQKAFHFFAKQNQSMESFTSNLAALGISDLPSIPSAHPDQNPLDIFRSHIAERLAPLAGVSQETVFNSLDRSNKPETGDLVLAIPRLRLKGAKPTELGEKWQSQVRPVKPKLMISLASRRYWRRSLQRAHFYNSSFRIKR